MISRRLRNFVGRTFKCLNVKPLNCLVLGGRPRLLDTEFLHPRAEGVGMETESQSCAMLAFNDPPDRLEDMTDVRTLDFFETIRPRRRLGPAGSTSRP